MSENVSVSSFGAHSGSQNPSNIIELDIPGSGSRTKISSQSNLNILVENADCILAFARLKEA